MFPKKYRLPTIEIVKVAKFGKRLPSDLFDIRVWWDSNLNYPQFALAVGLKVSKSAVIRNTIKRKLRAATTDLLKTNHLKKGKYLIIAKSDKLEDIDSLEIKEMLSKSLNLK